jgi:hypothetical protein
MSNHMANRSIWKPTIKLKNTAKAFIGGIEPTFAQMINIRIVNAVPMRIKINDKM